MDNKKFNTMYELLKKCTTPENVHKIFCAILDMSLLIEFDFENHEKVSYNKHKGRYNNVVDAIAISHFRIKDTDNLYTGFITPGVKYYIRIIFYKKYIKIPGGIKIRVYKDDPKQKKEDGTRPKVEFYHFVKDLINYDPAALYNLEKGLFNVV